MLNSCVGQEKVILYQFALRPLFSRFLLTDHLKKFSHSGSLSQLRSSQSPMPYKANWLKKGVEWIFHGHLTACMNIYGDSRFDGLTYKIVDFMDVEGIQLTEESIKKIAYFDMAAAKTNPTLNVAIISDNDILESYSGLYAAYMTETTWDIEFFVDRKSASEWQQKIS